MTKQEQKATAIEDAVALILPKQKKINDKIRGLNHQIILQKNILNQHIKEVCSSKGIDTKTVKRIIE